MISSECNLNLIYLSGLIKKLVMQSSIEVIEALRKYFVSFGFARDVKEMPRLHFIALNDL